MFYTVDDLEDLCDRFGVDRDDLFGAVLYVSINGSEENLVDTLMSGGEQCENCGSWAKCSPDDPEARPSMDGEPYKQVGYVWTSRRGIKCEGCGGTYMIKVDLEQRERI